MREKSVDRPPGLSVRLKLTLSYAGFVMLAGTLLLAAVWVFLLRGRPNSIFVPDVSDFLRSLDPHNFGPRAFLPAALALLALLLVAEIGVVLLFDVAAFGHLDGPVSLDQSVR